MELLPRTRQLYSILKSDPMVTDTDLDAMGLPKTPLRRKNPAPPSTSPSPTPNIEN
ncbi:MAG: hypothetical protein LBU42_03425 [Prevotellaceae bacterium]|jgi:hypothetical protein|nr:hypothetical protein [Prevotellaceae bacterium]